MNIKNVISKLLPFDRSVGSDPCAAMIRAGSLGELMTLPQLTRAINGRRALAISESKKSIAALISSLSGHFPLHTAVFRPPFFDERGRSESLICIRSEVIPAYSENDAEAIAAAVTSADMMIDRLAPELGISLDLPVWGHMKDSLEDAFYYKARRYHAISHLLKDRYSCLLIHLESLNSDTLAAVVAAAIDREIFLLCDNRAMGEKKFRQWRNRLKEKSLPTPVSHINRSYVRKCPPVETGEALILAAGDDNYFVTVTALAKEISNRRPVSIWSATPNFLRKPLLGFSHVACHDIDLVPNGSPLPSDLDAAVESSIRLLPFHRPLQSLMRRTFEKWVLKQPTTVVEVYMAALFRFKSCRPSYVVACGGRDIFVRAIVEAAKEQGIPTIDVQAVLLTDYKRLRRPVTDWVSVMETMSRDLMINHFGFPANRILVAGSPRNDAMLGGARRTSSSFKRSVLMATQPVERKQTHEIIEALIAAVSEVEGATLSIKLHPREGEEMAEYWRDVVRRLNGGRFCRVLPLETKLSDAVSEADLVAMQFSNAGLEAGILGCDVLSIALNGRFPLDFSSQGLAFGARSSEEIAPLVVKYLTDRSFRETVTKAREQFLELNPQLTTNESASTIVDHLEAISQS